MRLVPGDSFCVEHLCVGDLLVKNDHREDSSCGPPPGTTGRVRAIVPKEVMYVPSVAVEFFTVRHWPTGHKCMHKRDASGKATYTSFLGDKPLPRGRYITQDMVTNGGYSLVIDDPQTCRNHAALAVAIDRQHKADAAKSKAMSDAILDDMAGSPAKKTLQETIETTSGTTCDWPEPLSVKYIFETDKENTMGQAAYKAIIDFSESPTCPKCGRITGHAARTKQKYDAKNDIFDISCGHCTAKFKMQPKVKDPVPMGMPKTRSLFRHCLYVTLIGGSIVTAVARFMDPEKIRAILGF